MENLPEFGGNCQFGFQKQLIIVLIGLLGLPLSRAGEVLPGANDEDGKYNLSITGDDIKITYANNTHDFRIDDLNITHVCFNAVFDAALTESDGSMYFFQNIWFWTLSPPKKKEGPKCSGPHFISSRWATLRGPIEAAFSAKIKGQSVTYFFSGWFTWRFSGLKNNEGVLQPDAKGPKEKSAYFPSVPPYLDAAFVWQGDGLAYFIKGTDYWAYNLEKNELDESDTYPNPISKWGLPVKNIDAALSHPNGHVYFFVGDKYYRYNDPKLKIPRSAIPYPRKTHVGIFWCRDDEVAPGVNFQFYVEPHESNVRWSLSSSASFIYVELLVLLISIGHNLKSSLIS